jgi:geranylgeranyl pyrophosphate synthase
MLADHDALDFAARRAIEFAESARGHMDAFPETPEREALSALAEYVLTRDR